MKPTLSPSYQPELFEPEHVSLQTNRLDRMPEFVYARRWKILNERSPGVNRGFTSLEWILARDCKPENRLFNELAYGGWAIPGVVSQRDAAVAASVVQWLGTNCGYGFMLGAEEEIAKIQECQGKAEDERRKVHRVRWHRPVESRRREPLRAMSVDRRLPGL